MKIEIRKYENKDIQSMIKIWNQVVEEGVAFPQEECLTQETGEQFFAEQTYCGVAVDVCENMCCIWEGIIGNAWRMLGNIEKV